VTVPVAAFNKLVVTSTTAFAFATAVPRLISTLFPVIETFALPTIVTSPVAESNSTPVICALAPAFAVASLVPISYPLPLTLNAMSGTDTSLVPILNSFPVADIFASAVVVTSEVPTSKPSPVNPIV